MCEGALGSAGVQPRAGLERPREVEWQEMAWPVFSTWARLVFCMGACRSLAMASATHVPRTE
eukprot:12937861-Prorocentrum_lima.AAC.1